VGKYITVQPAYGREFNSVKAVLESWNADQDFAAIGFGQHGYLNRLDWVRAGAEDSIEVRYGKNGMKVMVITKDTKGVKLDG